MKRLIDVVIAGSVLVIAFPLMVIVAVIVRVTSPGPAFHRQERIGLHGKPFTLYKFRSMTVGGDDAAHREFNRRELAGELDHLDDFALPNDSRITKVGAHLRHLSLDELPQLINVLKRDMSLVGPRPSLAWEVEMFDPKFKRRSEVRPGITGLWQVTGRNTISMTGMLELDIEYVERRTLLFDLQILARTIPAVLGGAGAA